MEPKLTAAVARWLEWDKCPSTRAEIEALVATKDYVALDKMLCHGRLEFGTAGLRAAMGAGYTRMNHLTVLQTAQGFSKYVKTQHLERFSLDSPPPCMVVGYDARHNSKEYAAITANVFARAGFKVWLFRQAVCTPYVVLGVRHYKALCGVTVTASHNPKEDNGYKVCWSNAAHLIPPHDAGIAAEIEANLEPWADSWEPAPTTLGTVEDPFNTIHELFHSSLHDAILFEDDISAPSNGLKVVYTAMHGVGTEFVERALLEELKFPKANYYPVPEQCFPDPEFTTVTFPNPEEGRSALDLAMRLGDKVEADLILANDPDADRFAVAERLVGADGQTQWKLLTGNQLGALFGWWALTTYKIRLDKQNEKMMQRGEEGGGSVVATPFLPPLTQCAMLSSTVSSRILTSMAAKEGFYFEETLTGFKWLGTKSQEQTVRPEGPRKVLFAFEESIGYMYGDRIWDKDGVTALSVLVEMAVWLRNQKHTTLTEQLDEIYQEYGYHDSSNSYVISRDTAQTNAMFKGIREPQYPTEIGGAKVTWVRDLTTGYESTTADHKPLLPETPGANMISMALDNGITFTIRSSGTEPKLKWYSERVTATKPSPGELDAFVAEHIVGTLMRPSHYGFYPKPE